MAKTKTTRYDVAEHLRTPEEMAAYLEACLEEANGDAAFIAKALGDIARAKGMSQVARDAGLSRESLYKASTKLFNVCFARMFVWLNTCQPSIQLLQLQHRQVGVALLLSEFQGLGLKRLCKL